LEKKSQTDRRQPDYGNRLPKVSLSDRSHLPTDRRCGKPLNYLRGPASQKLSDQKPRLSRIVGAVRECRATKIGRNRGAGERRSDGPGMVCDELLLGAGTGTPRKKDCPAMQALKTNGERGRQACWEKRTDGRRRNLNRRQQGGEKGNPQGPIMREFKAENPPVMHRRSS